MYFIWESFFYCYKRVAFFCLSFFVSPSSLFFYCWISFVCASVLIITEKKRHRHINTQQYTSTNTNEPTANYMSMYTWINSKLYNIFRTERIRRKKMRRKQTRWQHEWDVKCEKTATTTTHTSFFYNETLRDWVPISKWEL